MAIIPTSGEFTKVPEGGGGGVFFVTDNNNTLDKTWAEISAASENGVVLLNRNGFLGYLANVVHTEDYFCTFMFPAANPHGDLGISFRGYSTSAEDGYPVHY